MFHIIVALCLISTALSAVGISGTLRQILEHNLRFQPEQPATVVTETEEVRP